MASTSAKRVSRLMVKPNSFRKKNVPIIATGTAMAGIRVERKSCRKINTTINTRIKASMIVKISLEIEASRNSLALANTPIFTPLGKLFSASFRIFSVCLMMSCALEPAVWLIAT
ncbi:hypothetical protein D3C87_1474770 [compost metagenome]